jgi:hypothetical protein
MNRASEEPLGSERAVGSAKTLMLSPTRRKLLVFFC